MFNKFLQSKLVVGAAFISLIAVGAVFQLAAAQLSNSAVKIKQAKVLINGAEFRVAVAANSKERYRGLSGVKKMCEICGLLFVFPDSQERTFVMRDMHFPLDIVFINEGVVSHIASNLLPDSPGIQESERTLYYSQGKADRVLELLAGTASKQGINIGDKVITTIYEY